MCIPFIHSGGPNECWLHMCDAWVIKTWRLGLRAPLLTHKYTAGFSPASDLVTIKCKLLDRRRKGQRKEGKTREGLLFPSLFPLVSPLFPFPFHVCHSQAANWYLAASPPNHLVTDEITIKNRLNLAQHHFELS